MTSQIKLTEYSHGAGCGCKLSPGVLADILGSNKNLPSFERLLVGNDTKDDAAVIDLDGKTAIVSTTDFFMPIVDDAFDFGLESGISGNWYDPEHNGEGWFV